jgi:predicted protein tyrosine phosphatase
MIIRVLSQEMAENYAHDQPHVFVSIISPGGEKVALPNNEGRLAVVRLCFHDVDQGDPHCVATSFLAHHDIEAVPARREDASLVKVAVEANPGADILVNCEAGISRSAGVAAAISKALTGDDERYFRRYRPNMHVYRLFYREFAGAEPPPVEPADPFSDIPKDEPPS